MEKLSEIIVPLIIFAIVIVNFIVKIAKAKQQQNNPAPPPSKTRPEAKDDWGDLLEALGQERDDGTDPDRHRPHDVGPIPGLSTPTTLKEIFRPQPASAPPPLPPPPLPPPAPEFIRASDLAPRHLGQIDDHIQAKRQRLAETFTGIQTNFTDIGTNITPTAVIQTATRSRVAHPVIARFSNRQSLREAIVMTEILGQPIALRP